MTKLFSSPVFPSFLMSGSGGKRNSARHGNRLCRFKVGRSHPSVTVSGASIARGEVPAAGPGVTVLFGLVGVQLLGHKLCAGRWQKWAFLFTSAGCNVHPKLSRDAE